MDANAVLEAWDGRTGAYSPDYYAYFGSNETSAAVRDVLDGVVGRDAAVLELGCGVGRHLAHLHAGGYRDLHGIDVNGDAVELLAETYPALAEDGTFHAAAIEDVLPTFADGQFDAVYSVETLQHVHHDNAWVFEEVARVTDDVLVTVELEGDAGEDPTGAPTVSYVDDAFPLYYRNWGRTFTDLGLEQVESRSLGKDTLRVFHPAES
ncbi:MAG: class I SAM-dependent methyltransferase [Halobacteriales archaeon]